MIRGNWTTREVTINGKALSPKASQKVRNHSPDGFAWGYAGSGPAQLAFALLLHFTSLAFAVKNYQDFKREVIATLPQDDFAIPVAPVLTWIREREAE